MSITRPRVITRSMLGIAVCAGTISLFAYARGTFTPASSSARNPVSLALEPESSARSVREIPDARVEQDSVITLASVVPDAGEPLSEEWESEDVADENDDIESDLSEELNSDLVGQAVPLGPPPTVPVTSSGSGACPVDMQLVEGQFCPRVSQHCQQWDDGGRRRCVRFARPSRCRGRREPMAFCMDTYEWPNVAGEKPEVMATWMEGAAACRAKGKRLCTQTEWTYACEGDEMLPYPYGYDRDASMCTIDHHAAAPDRALMHSAVRSISMAEVERVYEASVSGGMPGCKSPFGVMDLTGNVDEWTINESGHPYRSALKGGWWGRIRARCRPATLAHYERFRYYQIGYRCCANRK